jgi:hypothetical protein
MLKILLFAILIVLVISILLFIYIKNRRQATKIYTIHTFLGSSSTALEDEPNEQKKSLIDIINDYFLNSKDHMIDDDNDDIGDDGDGGE